jgi:hypothetical protein
MERVRATRILDFGDIAGSWYVAGLTVTPTGGVDVLLVSAPTPGLLYPRIEWSEIERHEQAMAAHALVSFPPGPSGELNYELSMPTSAERYFQAFRLPDEQWLLEGTHGYDVVDSAGQRRRHFNLFGGALNQATSDGRIWGGFTDQMMAGSGIWDGAVCFDAYGNVLFRFNEYAQRTRRAASIWGCDGINVLSDQETWISYTDNYDGKANTRGRSLVRVVDFEVDNVFPWAAVTAKANRLPWSFAVTSETILVQGYSLVNARYRTEESPSARVFLTSLASKSSKEYLPVDENGQWIGYFRSKGRGSRLYLVTDYSLFMLDAAELS